MSDLEWMAHLIITNISRGVFRMHYCCLNVHVFSLFARVFCDQPVLRAGRPALFKDALINFSLGQQPHRRVAAIGFRIFLILSRLFSFLS
jgi:hypothetical protein